jgi:hypothetical protein
MKARQFALVMALLSNSCAGTGSQPPTVLDARDPHEQSAVREQLFPVAIVFEPALSKAGTLSVRHESGWAVVLQARPSGVDFVMPEGPASLLLVVGEHRFERTLKVASRSDGHASSCVWRLPH